MSPELLPLIYVTLTSWLHLHHIMFISKNPWGPEMSSSKEGMEGATDQGLPTSPNACSWIQQARTTPWGTLKPEPHRGLQGLSARTFSLPPRGLLEDKIFHEAVDQSLVEQMPYFCQFWNEQSAKVMVQNNSLHLVPAMSPSSNSSEDSKDKEQEEDKRRLGKKDSGEEEENGEEEEEELEEEEEEEEEMEEEGTGKEELEEKGEKVAWAGAAASQESLKWQWQQQLKVTTKEKQEQDEKEAISR